MTKNVNSIIICKFRFLSPIFKRVGVSRHIVTTVYYIQISTYRTSKSFNILTIVNYAKAIIWFALIVTQDLKVLRTNSIYENF